MATVTLTISGERIATLALSHPETLNAMGESMAVEFATAVEEIGNQTDPVRVLILRGEGRAFSAGGDLAMLQEKTTLSETDNYRRMVEFYDRFLSFYQLSIPTITVLHGAAVGAGLCMACASDIRIAEEGTKLAFSFTRLGLHPGMGATYFLPKVVGESTARQLLITGRSLAAEEALRIGLVSEVVPAGAGYERALEVAREILGNGPMVTKELIETMRSPLTTLSESLAREARQQARNYKGEEFLAGISAAREKRKPVY